MHEVARALEGGFAWREKEQMVMVGWWEMGSVCSSLSLSLSLSFFVHRMTSERHSRNPYKNEERVHVESWRNAVVADYYT
jgi:hypothetical protein